VIPPPPAPDAVLFRSSLGRVVALHAGAAVVGWLSVAVFSVGLAAVMGWPVARIAGGLVGPALIFPTVVLGVPLVRLVRSPHWIRLSAAGVEIGTTDAKAVLIPWSGVESATVHGASIFANLDIVAHPTRQSRCSTARAGYPGRAGATGGGAIQWRSGSFRAVRAR
jgi:hypothetical protein